MEKISRGVILIVEDDQSMAHEVASHFVPDFAVHFATTVRDASRMIKESALVAAIFDVQLPDGSGLEVLREFREACPVTPALVLTRHTSPLVINEVHLLGAQFAVKHDCGENVARFRASLDVASQELGSVLSHATARLSSRHRMSAREAEVLELAARHVSRENIAAQLAVSINTVRTHVRNILYKSGATSMQELLSELVGNDVA